MELANIQDQSAFLANAVCRLQLSRRAIFYWTSGRKLGTEQGLRLPGRKRMIDWNALSAFMRALIAGLRKRVADTLKDIKLRLSWQVNSMLGRIQREELRS